MAGVPVAHWGGNKAGVGYSKHAPSVLVGGPNSVDLPSNHKHRRGGRGRYHNNRGRGSTNYQNQRNKVNNPNKMQQHHNNPVVSVPPPPPLNNTSGSGVTSGGATNTVGRGLLETPVVSPWQQGFGYEEIQNTNFKRYMKGMQKVEEVRSNISKLQHQRQVYSNRTRYQHNQQQHQKYNNSSNNTAPTKTTPHHQQQQRSSDQQQLHNSYYSQQQQHFNNKSSNSYNSFHNNKQDAGTFNSNEKNTWFGKGRGMQSMASSTSSSYTTPIGRGVTTPSGRGGYRMQHQQLSLGRGQWLPSNNFNIDSV